MQQDLNYENFTDAEGNPAGGYVRSNGVSIEWQDGPLGRGADRIEPNGAFVEDVIGAAIERIEFYQGSKFECDSNADALTHLKQALAALNSRTAEREARQVEGTHEQ